MKNNWNDALQIARTAPDFIGAMRTIGIELKKVGRGKGGAIRYQTTQKSHTAGDLSSVVCMENSDGSWVIFDNKARFGKTSMDAIDVIQHFGGVSFKEAVDLLAAGRAPSVGAGSIPAREITPVVQPPEPVEFEPPPAYNTKMRNVIAYLTKCRKIPEDLVQLLIDTNHIYAGMLKLDETRTYPYDTIKQDGKVYSKSPLCSFRILNEQGDVVGVDSCSTLSNYRLKHITAGSNPDYAWCFAWKAPEITPQTPLFFCESPIDAMSLCALMDEGGIYISMAGVKDNTLISMAEKLGGRPVICVDSDEAGDRFAARFPQYTRLTVPVGKDWNDCLQHYVRNGMPYGLSPKPVPVADAKSPVPAAETHGDDGDELAETKKEARAPLEGAREDEITASEMEQIRAIGRKSVNRFSENDWRVTERWQEKYRIELGVKSPFFRAKFGDWREYESQTFLAYQPVSSDFTTLESIPRGTYTNRDTRWNICVVRDGIEETAHKKGKNSPEYHSLTDIDRIISSAVLFDTVAVGEPSKRMGKSAVFVHHLYAPILINNRKSIAKLYITENIENERKFYLAKIEEVSPTSISASLVETFTSGAQGTVDDTSMISIAQLYAFVKTYDQKFERDSKLPVYFEPNPADPSLLHPDGTPKVTYDEFMKQSKQTSDDTLYDAEPAPAEASAMPQNESPVTNKEQLENALRARVTEAVNRYREDPRALAEFLAFASRFNNYSPANLRLIWCQNPDARFVAPASYFRIGMPDEKGVPLSDDPIFIRKGERAMRIWKPFEQTIVTVPMENGQHKKIPLRYLDKDTRARATAEGWDTEKRVSYTLVPVFDIAQTTAPAELYPKAFGFGGNEVRDAERMCRAISTYAADELHCPVTVADIGSRKATTRGFFSPMENSITLSDMLSGDGKLSTLLHELGHAELHRQTDGRIGKSEAQIELEADMYALMLESRLGVEPTDARCRHLGAHYEAYMKELGHDRPQDEPIGLNADMAVMQNVMRRYSAQAPLIEEYIGRQASIDAQLSAAGVKVADKPVAEQPVQSEKCPKKASRTPDEILNEGVRQGDELCIRRLTTEPDILQYFDIAAIHDYVGVQKAVKNKLETIGFFEKQNSVIVNSDSGLVVEITRKGIGETFGPGQRFQTLPRELKLLKLQAILQIPRIIEQGKLLTDNVKNLHDPHSVIRYAYLETGIETALNDATIKANICVTIRKSPQKNTFWVHEVHIKERELSLSPGEETNPPQGYQKPHTLYR